MLSKTVQLKILGFFYFFGSILPLFFGLGIMFTDLNISETYWESFILIPLGSYFFFHGTRLSLLVEKEIIRYTPITSISDSKFSARNFLIKTPYVILFFIVVNIFALMALPSYDGFGTLFLAFSSVISCVGYCGASAFMYFTSDQRRREKSAAQIVSYGENYWRLPVLDKLIIFVLPIIAFSFVGILNYIFEVFGW